MSNIRGMKLDKIVSHTFPLFKSKSKLHFPVYLYECAIFESILQYWKWIPIIIPTNCDCFKITLKLQLNNSCWKEAAHYSRSISKRKKNLNFRVYNACRLFHGARFKFVDILRLGRTKVYSPQTTHTKHKNVLLNILSMCACSTIHQKKFVVFV